MFTVTTAHTKYISSNLYLLLSLNYVSQDFFSMSAVHIYENYNIIITAKQIGTSTLNTSFTVAHNKKNIY